MLVPSPMRACGAVRARARSSRRPLRSHPVWPGTLGVGLLATSCVVALSDLDDYRFESRGTAGGDGGGVVDEGSDAPGVVFTDPAGCSSGARRCVGDAIQTCRDGAWGEALACAEPTPACNAGVCARMRLSGALASLPPRAAAPYRLVQQGFEGNVTSCGVVGGASLCVTGGLRP